MKKTTSFILLILATQAVTKTPDVPNLSNLLRNAADEIDKIGQDANASWESFGEGMNNLLEQAEETTSKVKKALGHRSSFYMKDEENSAIITIQIGDIAPDKSKSVKIEGNTFRIDLKEGGSNINIIGSVANNLLMAHITGHSERTTKDGKAESVLVNDATIQRTIIGELELENLSADFTKADKTLTITIPKKQTPEKEVHNIAVNIK